MCQLTFDLSGYGTELIGKHFEIQIELLDSFKRLHKSVPISQVLITPEFFGHPVVEDQPIEIEEESEAPEEKLVNLVVVTQDKQEEEEKKEAAGILENTLGVTQKIKSPGVSVLASTKINGIDYKIYTGLPDNKHIENYKIFVMEKSQSTSVLTEINA